MDDKVLNSFPFDVGMFKIYLFLIVATVLLIVALRLYL